MSSPLFYILAPFGLAFALFAVYLIVSIFLRDPARPFRMFGAPPLDKEQGAGRPSTGLGTGRVQGEEEEDEGTTADSC